MTTQKDIIRQSKEKETGFKNAIEIDNHNRMSNRNEVKRKGTTHKSFTPTHV